MIRRIVTFETAPASSDLGLLADEETLVALSPAATAAVEEPVLAVEGGAIVLVHLDSAAGGAAAASALHADIFVAGDAAAVTIGDAAEGLVVAGMVRRIGRRAVPLLLENDLLDAEVLISTGLADVRSGPVRDTMIWLDEWIGQRSLSAVALAARLIRNGSSDEEERASFSQLFAESEVHEGLSAFLERRTPQFGAELIRERR